MTTKHFIDAAAIVQNILDDEWSMDAPDWADDDRYSDVGSGSNPYCRAVQTAEAFIILFQQHNPRFDMQRFLVACGLAS